MKNELPKGQPPLPKMRPESAAKTLLEVIKYVSNFFNTKESTMIEIGSFTGESTVIFAREFKTVITIDPFIPYLDVRQESALRTYKQDRWNHIEEVFNNRIKPFSNILHLKMLSDDAVKEIKASVDFVYIDGMHTYDQCKKDIQNYLPLIKATGIIAGHDYSSAFPGVKKSVNELLASPDIVIGKDGNWIKKVSGV